MQDKKSNGRDRVAETGVISSSKIQEEKLTPKGKRALRESRWMMTTQPDEGRAPGTLLLPTDVCSVSKGSSDILSGW